MRAASALSLCSSLLEGAVFLSASGERLGSVPFPRDFPGLLACRSSGLLSSETTVVRHCSSPSTTKQPTCSRGGPRGRPAADVMLSLIQEQRRCFVFRPKTSEQRLELRPRGVPVFRRPDRPRDDAMRGRRGMSAARVSRGFRGVVSEKQLPRTVRRPYAGELLRPSRGASSHVLLE